MEVTEYGIGTRRSNVPTEEGTSASFFHNEAFVVDRVQVERHDGHVNPVGGTVGSGPFEFIIPPVADAYLMMNKLQLNMHLRIVKADGTNCDSTDNVAPVNALGAVFWEHAEVHLNDYPMGGSSASNIHYKAYIETILSYDATARDTHLKNQLFQMDDPDKYDVMEGGTGVINSGFKARKAMTAESKKFDVIGPLTIDFLRANRHLTPGNKLSIKLTKAQDKFLLMSPNTEENYKIEIDMLKLYYYRVRLAERIQPPPIERYLFSRTELKRFPIPAGTMEYNFSIHRGPRLPKSVIFAQVETEAGEGTYATNPFKFAHHDVKRLALRLNGRLIPSDPYTPDFKNKLVRREYASLFMNTGSYASDRSNCISYKQFLGGAALFAWDLTPDLCNSAHIHAGIGGDLTLELTWGNTTNKSLTILGLLIYDDVVVHKARENEFDVETI